MKNELLQAYTETHYVVSGSAPFVLRVGEVSEELLDTQAKAGVECSAFITAWNPFSEQRSESFNETAHQSLITEIKKRSLSFLPGEGRHPSNKWPPEKSVLVLGLSLEAAKTLGRRFEQNAVVWSGPDGKPVLVTLV